MLRYLVKFNGTKVQLSNKADAIRMARDNKGLVLDLLRTYRPDSLSHVIIADFTDP